MYCVHCGDKLSESDRFCSACGAAIQGQVKERGAPTPPPICRTGRPAAPSVQPSGWDTSPATGSQEPAAKITSDPEPILPASPHESSAGEDDSYPKSATAAKPPPNPRACGSSKKSISINADAFRVDGEQAALYGGLAVLVVVLLFSTAISLGFVLIGIAIAAVYVWKQQAQLVGSAVKVSKRQFPRIYAIANEVATRLDMHQPELYILQDPTLNALAMGFIWGKSVLLHSATVEAMTEDELKQIIGHEFAHIKCGHTNLAVLTSSSRRIYIPLITDFLGLIFLFWNRKSEYTCDRGGLLAGGDVKSAISGMSKLAIGPTLFEQMDIDDFLDQRRALDQHDMAKLSETLATHPYLVKRIHALQQYFHSRQYKQLSGNRD